MRIARFFQTICQIVNRKGIIGSKLNGLLKTRFGKIQGIELNPNLPKVIVGVVICLNFYGFFNKLYCFFIMAGLKHNQPEQMQGTIVVGLNPEYPAICFSGAFQIIRLIPL